MNKFKVGDKVICTYQQVAGKKTIKQGHIGTVTHVDGVCLAVDGAVSSGGSCVMVESAFELYNETTKGETMNNFYKIPEGYTAVEPFTDYEEAARFLDKMFPNWEEKIDLSSMRMSSFANCVLGQISKHVLTGNRNSCFDNGLPLADTLFGSHNCCVDGASVFGSHLKGSTNAEQHQQKWVEMIQDRIGISPLERELRDAKRKVIELEEKVKQQKEEEERRRTAPVTLTLTREEIQLLLDRKPSSVRQKITEQMQQQSS